MSYPEVSGHQSSLTRFFDDYDLYDNPYLQALESLLAETKSLKGFICAMKATELVIVSGDTEEYLVGYQGTIIDKAIKTKTPAIGAKKTILPQLGEVESVVVVPINNKEKVLGIVCLAGGSYNINTLKEIRQMLMVLRLHMEKTPVDKTDKPMTTKDVFLANMSHEIRTPLNGVIGYVQLLMQTHTSDQQRQYINAINKCSLNLAQIINDILDFSKLVSGKMKLNLTACKIHEIIDFVRETLNPKINEKQHSLIVKLSPELPEFVTIDKQKVIQVLMNLVSNAIKFTQRGGTITVNVLVKPENLLYFSVKDTGTGISREDQNKLFRSFTQLDNSIDKSFTGSGLGLAISKKLVDLLGGDISLRSEVGQGSEFFFTVKYEGYQSSLHKINTARPALFKNKSVLLAFGSVDERLHYSDVLLSWGMKPSLCGSSLEAKKLLGSFSYDFELCIIGLNDGLVDMIKESYPMMPVIDVGQSNPKSDYYLSPGCNKIDLFNTIEKALTNSRYVKKKDSLKINTDLKILIAEDQLSNQELLTTMLHTLGYMKIRVVNDGVEAKEALSEDTYDLILLDLKMPRMNGYQVMDHLKKTGNKIRVIPVTASVLEEDQQRCESYGTTTFLRKPISIKELQSALIF